MSHHETPWSAPRSTHEDACRVLAQTAGYSAASLVALRMRGAVEAALRGGG